MPTQGEIDGQVQTIPGSFGNPDPFQAASQFSQVSNDEQRYTPDLNEGDNVKHSVFGIGTILEMDGDTAVVYFKGKGTRKLNISFAPIEKL